MADHNIIIGVGGTGSKIIEAVVHLAASGNMPPTLYPVLIDQDTLNGNVEQCRESINSYNIIYEKSKKIKGLKIFNTNIDMEKIPEGLIPLVPTRNQKFSASIKYPLMSSDEKKVIEALYNRHQLEDDLKDGFKKRAHMGSAIISQMLEGNQDLTRLNERTRSLSPDIYIFGSIFGGTGASGLTIIGKYFKDNWPNSNVYGIVIMPYFKISDLADLENRPISEIVNSNSDMLLVKVALEIFYQNNNDSFNKVFFIGSDIANLEKDAPTKYPVSGGREQKNPAHIFELIAGSVISHSSRINNKYNFYIEDLEIRDIPIEGGTFQRKSKIFDIDSLPDTLDKQKIKYTREFSRMVAQCSRNKNSWKKRQPWLFFNSEYNYLRHWAERHDQWWQEMAADCWTTFRFDNKRVIDQYQMSSLISRHLEHSSARSIGDIIFALDSLIKWEKEA